MFLFYFILFFYSFSFFFLFYFLIQNLELGLGWYYMWLWHLWQSHNHVIYRKTVGADELLHLSIAIINFFQEKEFHNEYCLDGSFSNNDLFTCQLWAELNVWWSTFQRFSISIYSCPLNWIALIASHFCFLIQFIRFYSLWFFNVISWILLLKNNHFVFFTVFLKSFHSSTFLNAL